MRDSAAVERVGDQVLDDFDTVHVVVANAAVTRAGLAVSISDEDWRDVLDTNLTGAFYVARQFLPAFLANGFGRFIFMSSIAARGMSGRRAYSASKAGMLGLSGGAGQGVRAQGHHQQRAAAQPVRDGDDAEGTVGRRTASSTRQHCPVGRIGQVSEAAAAVLFLAE